MKTEGVSRRYTAITLLGLAKIEATVSRDILCGETIEDVAGRLLADVDGVENIGDVALTLWTVKAIGVSGADAALRRLRALDPMGGAHPTVEVAWCLAALCAPSPVGGGTDDELAERVARRLCDSFVSSSSLFPHWPAGGSRVGLRSHVSCYADLVYPIQALAFDYARRGAARSLEVANRCARRMCDLQGPAGQWWWHYDVRSGRVVEGYPVYAVHQDAMGPMALFALQDAGGDAFDNAIARGMAWLRKPAEIPTSLIDTEADLIWRKVARREPAKLSRGVQALASRVHPSFRAPGLGRLFPPRAIDDECRPYHLGWLLYAWADRAAGTKDEGRGPTA